MRTEGPSGSKGVWGRRGSSSMVDAARAGIFRPTDPAARPGRRSDSWEREQLPCTSAHQRMRGQALRRTPAKAGGSPDASIQASTARITARSTRAKPRCAAERDHSSACSARPRLDPLLEVAPPAWGFAAADVASNTLRQDPGWARRESSPFPAASRGRPTIAPAHAPADARQTPADSCQRRNASGMEVVRLTVPPPSQPCGSSSSRASSSMTECAARIVAASVRTTGVVDS
mmetsp:Transcript_9199/g.35984  ORF Transcript_9199/g.35984 Transcript_9199/m.35984 type:complete len:232 (-) Transcript_9199:423-1118(-)